MYQKGDLVKQPVKSRDVLPEKCSRGGVGYVMQGWGWVIQGWGGVGYVMQGWGGSYRGGVGYVM